MKARIGLFLVLGLLAAQNAALAWGKRAHEEAAALAEYLLQQNNAKAADAVKALLPEGETMVTAAGWADRARDATYTAQNKKNSIQDEDMRVFVGQNPNNAAWHYTTLPSWAEEYDREKYAAYLPAGKAPDIVQALALCIRSLRNQGDAQKLIAPRTALRMLIHLTADVHQPLHVVTAFVDETQPGKLRFLHAEDQIKGNYGAIAAKSFSSDVSGNRLVFKYGERYTNLHTYWDTYLPEKVFPQEDARANVEGLLPLLPDLEPFPENKPPSAWTTYLKSSAPETWPAQWATDSLSAARQAYTGFNLQYKRGALQFPPGFQIDLKEGYESRSQDLVKLQIAKAGYRLAGVLEAIWPGRKEASPPPPVAPPLLGNLNSAGPRLASWHPLDSYAPGLDTLSTWQTWPDEAAMPRTGIWPPLPLPTSVTEWFCPPPRPAAAPVGPLRAPQPDTNFKDNIQQMYGQAVSDLDPPQLEITSLPRLELRNNVSIFKVANKIFDLAAIGSDAGFVGPDAFNDGNGTDWPRTGEYRVKSKWIWSQNPRNIKVKFFLELRITVNQAEPGQALWSLRSRVEQKGSGGSTQWVRCSQPALKKKYRDLSKLLLDEIAARAATRIL